MKINLTKLEAYALHAAAGNLKDDLDYFKYLPQNEFKKFCESYKTGMNKLLIIIQNKNNEKNNPNITTIK